MKTLDIYIVIALLRVSFDSPSYIKITLEQATMVQRRSRDTALLFL